MITEELIDRLVAATREAKETIRECHEARRDLRLLLKEVDQKVAAVRDEVIKANNELAEREWRKAMDSIDVAALGAGLKKSFSQWTDLLAEASDVLEALHKRELDLRAVTL